MRVRSAEERIRYTFNICIHPAAMRAYCNLLCTNFHVSLHSQKQKQEAAQLNLCSSERNDPVFKMLIRLVHALCDLLVSSLKCVIQTIDSTLTSTY